MPQFKSKKHAHQIHENYDIDTDGEGKYDLGNIYRLNRHRIEFILDKIGNDSHVLEVGCNSGGLLRLISSELKCYCEGVDISEELVKRAIKKGMNCKVGVAEDLPYENERFDSVVITEVLEHIYDADEALSEIKRVLKSGGVIVGSVPHPDGENSTKKTIDEHKWHGKIFKRNQLSSLISNHFDNVEITDISWYNDQENKPQWIGFVARKA